MCSYMDLEFIRTSKFFATTVIKTNKSFFARSFWIMDISQLIRRTLRRIHKIIAIVSYIRINRAVLGFLITV